MFSSYMRSRREKKDSLSRAGSTVLTQIPENTEGGTSDDVEVLASPTKESVEDEVIVQDTKNNMLEGRDAQEKENDSQIDKTVHVSNLAVRYGWIAFVAPALELVFAVALSFKSCTSPVLAWLAIDGCVGLVSAVGIYVVAYYLAPLYSKWESDPDDFSSTWHQSWVDQSYELVLERHGIDSLGLYIVIAGITALVMSIMFTTIWAQVGIIVIIVGLLEGCFTLTLMVTLLYVMFRDIPMLIVIVFVYCFQNKLRFWFVGVALLPKKSTSEHTSYGAC